MHNNDLDFGARVLWGEIAQLAEKNGYCFASNAYLAKLFGVSVATVKRWIGDLVKVGFVKVMFDGPNGDRHIMVAFRTIEPNHQDGSRRTESEHSGTPRLAVAPPAHECTANHGSPMNPRLTGDTHNNSLNTKTKKRELRGAESRTRFLPPSLEEVSEYCKSRGSKVNPAKWHDYYTSNGWRVGKNIMRDWRAAVRTWENNDFSHGPKRSADSPTSTAGGADYSSVDRDQNARNEALAKKMRGE